MTNDQQEFFIIRGLKEGMLSWSPDRRIKWNRLWTDLRISTRRPDSTSTTSLKK